ncbi:hypothetical protein SDC9_203251 [bioreactor metagenome]|uniref:Uncharacterized protein n=1 Tax=bioreactor metagenome TaxID=1076179 RepID=A0A645IWR0_9ZZZZ
MRYRRRQLDHLFCLRHIIHANGIDQQCAFGTIEQRFQQQRLQLIAAQVVEDLAHFEAQEGFVFQRLHRPLRDGLQKLLSGFSGKSQLQQAWGLG